MGSFIVSCSSRPLRFTQTQPVRASCVPSSSVSCFRRSGRTPRVRCALPSWPPVVWLLRNAGERRSGRVWSSDYFYSGNDGLRVTRALKRQSVGGFTHLGRPARRLLLRFLPLEGRHDLNLSQGPLLPFLGASLVEDTVAELDAVLLEEEKDGRGKYFRQLEGSKVRSKGGVIGATRPVRRGASAFIRAYRAWV